MFIPDVNRRLVILAALAAPLFAADARAAGFKDAKEKADKTTAVESPYAVRLGAPLVTHVRVGGIVTAKRGAVGNVRMMTPIPLECPEQEVAEISDETNAQVVDVKFRPLNEGDATQILIHIPQLARGQQARALITYEVTTHRQLPPRKTDGLRLPTSAEVRKLKLKRYLMPSPFIDVGNRKIREAVKSALAKIDGDEKKSKTEKKSDDASEGKDDAAAADVTAEEPAIPAADAKGKGDWDRVAALYDYAQDHIAYEEGDDKSAVQALEDGKGDCQGISALFVAMCRTADVPARMVWVDKHMYAEFCLMDPEGVLHWYPVESAGMRAFGEMPTPRVVMQKGDNFRVPEKRRDSLRYAQLALLLSRPGEQPEITFVREQVK